MMRILLTASLADEMHCRHNGQKVKAPAGKAKDARKDARKGDAIALKSRKGKWGIEKWE